MYHFVIYSLINWRLKGVIRRRDSVFLSVSSDKHPSAEPNAPIVERELEGRVRAARSLSQRTVGESAEPRGERG